jgi:RNA polymerase sigma-B factor
MSRRYAGRGEPSEDLEQVGCLGLLKAIDRFDPGLGHHFLALAIPTITAEIRRTSAIEPGRCGCPAG